MPNEIVGTIHTEADNSSSLMSLQSMQSLDISAHSLTNSVLLMDRQEYMFNRMAEMHEIALNRVANAQDSYDVIVAKYGAKSPEAEKAWRNLETSQMMNTRITQQMAFQHEMYLIRTIPMLLSQITAIIAALQAIVAARTASEWFIGGSEMIAAGAMIAITMKTFQENIASSDSYNTTQAPLSSGGDSVEIYLQGGDWNNETASQFMAAIRKREAYSH